MIINICLDDNVLAEKLQKDAKSRHFSTKTLGRIVVDGGFVVKSISWHKDGKVDGGVSDEAQNYIDNTGYTNTGGCGYDEEFFTAGLTKRDKCIFLSTIHPVYGHAITDALRKVWYLHSAEGRKLLEDGYHIAYITTQNSEMPQWHLKILELAGVDLSKLIHIRETTRYDKIVVPDDSLFMKDDVMCYTKEFVNTIESLKSKVRDSRESKNTPPNERKCYYFTRTAFNHIMREMGEPSLERIFHRHGYTIVAPEKHDIEQQINMLMTCRKFAATECSTSHAAIFCSSDCEVAVLRKADYWNKYTAMIAELTNSPTTIVDAHHSVMANRKLPMLGPFYIYPTLQLRRFLGDNGFNFSYRYRPTYYVYLFSKKKFVRIILRVYDKLVRRGLGLRSRGFEK